MPLALRAAGRRYARVPDRANGVGVVPPQRVAVPRGWRAGRSGATHQPWQDHFRILDDGLVSGRRMLLGNWLVREKLGGWFTLEAMPDLLGKQPAPGT